MTVSVMSRAKALLWVSGVFLLSSIHGQTTELDRFVGRDLWTRQLSKKDLRRLTNIVGIVPRGDLREPDPWHVWKTNRSGETRYIVLLGESLAIIPGGSSACIQLFDAAAKRIEGLCFQTGWRITLVDASIEYSDSLASDLVVIHTAPVVNGLNIAREYFAIKNDRIRVVRMENDKGELVQNEYVFPNYEIGVVPTASSADEWERLLGSKDKVDVLSALVFLGGRHVDGPDQDFGPGPHESKYAGLFEQLAGSARIGELIQTLGKSDNVWIRQAAALAARGSRERLFR
jgi:hypothetical protein